MSTYLNDPLDAKSFAHVVDMRQFIHQGEYQLALDRGSVVIGAVNRSIADFRKDANQPVGRMQTSVVKTEGDAIRVLNDVCNANPSQTKTKSAKTSDNDDESKSRKKTASASVSLSITQLLALKEAILFLWKIYFDRM